MVAILRIGGLRRLRLLRGRRCEARVVHSGGGGGGERGEGGIAVCGGDGVCGRGGKGAQTWEREVRSRFLAPYGRGCKGLLLDEEGISHRESLAMPPTAYDGSTTEGTGTRLMAQIRAKTRRGGTRRGEKAGKAGRARCAAARVGVSDARRVSRGCAR
jgi:hypothetical protein